MTENRTIEHADKTVTYEQYFDWNSKQKGLILSSFFYGYITTQLVGGYLGLLFGGNIVFGLGIGMTAILTLLTPIAANSSLSALIAIRVVEGVFEGVSYPCIHAVW